MELFPSFAYEILYILDSRTGCRYRCCIYILGTFRIVTKDIISHIDRAYKIYSSKVVKVLYLELVLAYATWSFNGYLVNTLHDTLIPLACLVA